jgi:hypothetical protein
MAGTEDDVMLAKNRRRAMRTVLLLALVAVAFYVGIFFIVSWRHP